MGTNQVNKLFEVLVSGRAHLHEHFLDWLINALIDHVQSFDKMLLQPAHKLTKGGIGFIFVFFLIFGRFMCHCPGTGILANFSFKFLI